MATNVNRSVVAVFVMVVVIALAGCANNPNQRAGIGGGAGALLGGLIGSQLGDHGTRNAAIGAALGGLAGGGVGHYMDKQKRELDRKLKAEREQRQLDVQRLQNGALKIGVASDVTFAVDKSTLNQRAQQIFSKIASVMRDYQKTAVHVVGFTDSTGNKQHNLELSRDRSRSVSQFLVNHGVKGQRVLTWGRGESQPVATNRTKAGRAQNRRVAIIIKPIVKGRKKQAFSEPPPLGQR
ncbi:OmpA family protein [Salinisphaera sp. USBA-960]|uniref:OmpA family protein n=1 Tax=Salinisphaera orenii TaxID=856731 RepID=UPI00147334AF|nr:OmpA family protein [Salifodinibacter halophilus]NNC26266.1 OmpA family protein [Salifodinibacter halophilus]